MEETAERLVEETAERLVEETADKVMNKINIMKNIFAEIEKTGAPAPLDTAEAPVVAAGPPLLT